jgi:hypothetical protein
MNVLSDVAGLAEPGVWNDRWNVLPGVSDLGYNKIVADLIEVER